MGVKRGNGEKLADGIKKVLNYRGVKKRMENRNGCFMGAYVLGTWGQKYDEEFSHSEDADPRLTEVLNGRMRGQIQPAKMFHLAHIVVFQTYFK